MKTPHLLITLFCGAVLAGSAQAGPAAATPGATALAQELAALPDGGWLSIDKRGLHLLDAAGQDRAILPMRAKQLDTRPLGDNVLAVVLDANSERALPVLVDLQAGQLLALEPFPAPDFGVEASCLYRDAQQLDHLFLIGKDGLSEQWVMQDKLRLLVRKLALPTHVKHCRADDASHTLFVSEAGLGLWAYRADAEGPAGRAPLALRPPFGKLAGGAGALAVLPGGIALLDAKGDNLHLLRQQGGQWQTQPGQPLKLAKGSGQLTLRAGANGRQQLLVRDEQAKRWQTLTLAWKAAPAHTAAAGAAHALPFAIVEPQMQTEPVASQGDAADDPAIWVNAGNPAAGRVLGTNKKQGLLVYDLQGKQLQLLQVGRLNNVDLRQNVSLGAEHVDLAAATQRDDNTVMLFTIDAKGVVAEAGRFATGMEDIYGICLYQPPSGGLHVFANDKDGTFQQYKVVRQGAQFGGTLVRRFKVASQPEGCVADDRSGRLFIGEEKRGVWSMAAAADAGAAMQMILPVGPNLHADVEGMALYQGGKASYILVSSQGDNSYVVLDALPPHKLRGRFRIGYNLAAGIDGASETDGLEVSSANFGGPYANGLLVVQDGYKRLPDGPQNFKYVSWDAVARALQLD